MIISIPTSDVVAPCTKVKVTVSYTSSNVFNFNGANTYSYCWTK